jgi:hypothetical protein
LLADPHKVRDTAMTFKIADQSLRFVRSPFAWQVVIFYLQVATEYAQFPFVKPLGEHKTQLDHTLLL